MVGGSAEHFHALQAGSQFFDRSDVRASDAQQRSLAEASVLERGHVAEAVDAELALGITGLAAHFQHLRLQRKRVAVQIVHILDAPNVRQVVGERHALADAHVVDPGRDRVPVHEGERARRAAGDDLQGSSDALLDPSRDRDQVGHLFRSRLDGAVAAQVDPDARQVQVVQRAVHEHAGVHHLVLVPEAFAKVSQVRHDDDVMNDVPLLALVIERFHDVQVALQRIVRQLRDLRQFAHLRHAQQQVFGLQAGFPHLADLRQPAGAQLLRAGVQIGLRDLRVGPVALRDAAHVDAAASAAVHHFLRVIAQLL